MTDLRTTCLNPSDRKALEHFDAYVGGSPKGHILQTVAWGDLKARTGWLPVRYLVEDRSSGAARGAISVLLRRLPLPGSRLYLGYAPRGPVVDFADEAALSELSRAVASDLVGRGVIALKIDPDVTVDRTDVVARLEGLGLGRMERGLGFEGVQPRFVFRLPLDGGLDDVLASFHPKTRYNIRLAEKKGVTVRVGTNEADLGAFYRILVETARRDHFLVRAESYYRDMWQLLIKPGLGRLFLAETEGEILAGTIAFLLGDKAWYVYGASSSHRREVMPNYLLQWTMIRWAVERGCAIYDFRGVSGNINPTDPLYGLYRFKKGFGADLTEFIGEFDLVLRPTWYRLYSWGEPAYRRLRARLRGGGSSSGARAPEDAG